MSPKSRDKFPHNGDGENLVLHDRGLIVMPIGKCASQSLKHMVIDLYNMSPYDLSHLKRSRQWVVENKGDYCTFSFVRNPFDRIVSCWLDKTQRTFYYGLRLLKGTYKGMSFSRFLKVIKGYGDEHPLCDGHFRSQTAHLFTDDGELLCDMVFKCEELAEQWEIWHKHFNLPPELPRRQVSNNRSPYSDYFQHRTDLMDIVRRRYEDDFKFFYPEFLE